MAHREPAPPLIHGESRPAPGRRRGADVDWDAEWQVTWKAHPGNAWFGHQAEALAARLGHISADCLRVLKTDAFEEACGFPTLLGGAGRRRVLMDVSPRILAQAASRLSRDRVDVMACAMDVRRLALRRKSFDLVLSHSTADHFSCERDIVLALREMHAILRPGGRLVITLDNPRNPILAVRRMVHRITGPIGGLMPFSVGRTLSRARLVAALEHEGFQMLASGYVLHTPRLLGLWTAEWAARLLGEGDGRHLRRLFGGVERVLDVLPTRAFTGHFVIADCRRPEAP